jgi:type II secretory pathway pseudopilin PulG
MGEDTISMVVVIMIIGLLLAVVTTTFVNRESEAARIEKYRVASIIADRLATDWGWEGSGVIHSRVLDRTKLTPLNCPDLPYDGMINVSNQSNGAEILICGSLADDEYQTSVRLPVTIRESYKEFYPGVLEVRVSI